MICDRCANPLTSRTPMWIAPDLCSSCGAALNRMVDENDELRAENERLTKELAESLKDDDEWTDYEIAEMRARQGATDARLRELLGSCWSHLWGPPLERLGGDYDELKKENAKLRATLYTIASEQPVSQACQNEILHLIKPRAGQSEGDDNG